MHIEILADYYQFYLQDEKVDGNLSDSWDQDAFDRLLAMAPGIIGVGTVRNTTVPVVVEIHESEPTEDFDEWDHVNECSIEIESGKILIAGCNDYFPDAARIEVEPGCYRARIYYGQLDSLSEDGLDGDDHYKIILWRAAYAEPKILKQRAVNEGA